MPPLLITSLFTADPSAHAFEGRIFVYPSHDRETDIAFNDNGDQYDMVDYHVFSLDDPSAASFVTVVDNNQPQQEQQLQETDKEGKAAALVIDHGVALALPNIPWASRQLWAPDAARHPLSGEYLLFFPARDHSGVFRIGVAVSSRPGGPFKADPLPIPGTYSVDPCVFVDDQDKDKQPEAYLYFGGLWGGQLQCFDRSSPSQNPVFNPALQGPHHEPTSPSAAALGPRVARLSPSMRSLAEPAREVVILAPDSEGGLPLRADDRSRRFFEAAWVHRRRGVYYLSWSTGDTHRVCYARGTSPYGPFTYEGVMLEPVVGWTTHHSVVEFHRREDGEEEERWWLFYHDCERSGGVSHLRTVKVKEVWYDDEGRIVTERPVRKEEGER